MGRLWTDQQEAAYRATERPGGRWSGEQIAQPSAAAPGAPIGPTGQATPNARPTSLWQDVLRAVREFRQL